MNWEKKRLNVPSYSIFYEHSCQSAKSYLDQSKKNRETFVRVEISDLSPQGSVFPYQFVSMWFVQKKLLTARIAIYNELELKKMLPRK